MPNNILFMTDGTWDNTNVFSNNEPLSCRRINVQLTIYNTEDGEAGVDEGGSLEGFVDYFAPGANPNNLNELTRGSIFPGKIEFQVNNQSLSIICDDPELNFLDTQVFMDGMEITDSIARVYASIDAVEDVVSIWFKYKTGEQFGIASFDNKVLI
jgi:hypothetical protein